MVYGRASGNVARGDYTAAPSRALHAGYMRRDADISGDAESPQDTLRRSPALAQVGLGGIETRDATMDRRDDERP